MQKTLEAEGVAEGVAEGKREIGRGGMASFDLFLCSRFGVPYIKVVLLINVDYGQLIK